MAKPLLTVEAYLAKLEHPMKDGILALRKTILGVDAEITEQIKWNAPSFCHSGDDRITFRLPPNGKGGIQLIFHRGAKSKDAADFKFVDPSGLVEWAASDRGVVTFKQMDEIAANTPKFVTLVKTWLRATDTRLTK
jgi:hypothetical protein